jgi:transcriptional regulator with GAF, ATPase, and Fis domain
MDVYASLFALARRLFAEKDPAATAEILLSEVRALCGADRGFVVVREGDRYVQKLELDFADPSDDERAFSRTLVARALEEQALVAVDGASVASQFRGVESLVALGAGAVRAVPLVAGGKSIGAIYLDRRAGPFAPEADRFLRELGEIAALVIQRALERDALRRRNKHLERDLFAQHDFRGIVTRDPRMLELLRMVAQVADTGATVLVCGETGTGKELIARALHLNSGRARHPFVTVHCSALPSTLLEAELFGHVKGAFTGADRDRPGRLASAHGGTLFLDEIGELSPEVQAKLLRFLQFGELQRLGTDSVISVDVRVIAATHEDLAAMVAARRFRQDLYFRLKVVEVTIPPLRERRGDILLIADAMLREKWRRGGERPAFSPAAERALAAYAFPGNVRELVHIVERACVLARGPQIDLDLLPPEVVARVPDAAPPRFARFDADTLSAARADAVAAVEREFVKALLAEAGGNVSQAARIAAMNRTYLQRLVGKYKD